MAIELAAAAGDRLGAAPHPRPPAVATAARPRPSAPATSVPRASARSRSTYDLDAVRRGSSRPPPSPPGRPGIWRYLELLPVEAAARARAQGRQHPARPRGPARRVDRRRRAADQGRHPQPDAVVQGPGGRDRRGPASAPSASRRSAARAPATSRARRRPRPRAIGVPAYVFVPADLEPAKIEHALAYGATVVRIDGTYDDVNRLCLEVADELPWGAGQRQPPPVLRRGQQDARLRDRRGPRLAAARRRGGPDRVGRDGHPARAGVRGAGRARLGRGQAGPVRRRSGRRLCAGRHGVRRRPPGHRAGPDAGHDRALAGDRQPRRRALRGGAGAGVLGVDRGDRRRRRRRTRSGGPRRSRASTRRPPAA